MDIRQVIKLWEGMWYVSYTKLAPCGCMIVRDKIKIKQKKQPTNKQITDAVNNKNRGQV